MAIRIKNVPSPEVLMNSMRAMGYSFKTAIADIIDNSISAKAKNIWLFFPTSSLDEQFVSIIDDGRGMNKEELFNAMKYGSDRKDSEEDLGRFGLGLKSASLSQCRVLTVASKKNGVISCFRWDLDEIVYSKEWNCLELQMDEFENMPYFSFFKSLNEGTIVLWQKFDIAEKNQVTGLHIRLFLKKSMKQKNMLGLYFIGF